MIRSGTVVAGRHGQAQADLQKQSCQFCYKEGHNARACPKLALRLLRKVQVKHSVESVTEAVILYHWVRLLYFKILNSISQVLLGPFAIFKILSSISHVLLGPFAIFKILNSISQVLLGPVASFLTQNSLGQKLLGPFARLEILYNISHVSRELSLGYWPESWINGKIEN